MRLHRVLLLTVVTLVASNSALVATEETSVSVLKHVAVSDRDGNQMRSLRFATTSDEKDKVAGEEDPTDANERTNSKSPLLI
ncbi:hypothetical protein JG687_00017392 [Phytophthora cactorum]|uniref:RxLR effector protein n=1 Tax=Phytophthora cactorum TaxID=29920 RepID=A0A329SKY7_9STRA|nr:hypothetical protein Pcac1_g5795 [Phytophthora cactorum]KAG2799449.1 hypothetical protein PC112_g20895 [Phytophthora cactorum]KAG2819412.1 hypothetical protein PC111_g11915 [Phytophthora cactorum]KAG2853852.1 hypothetical protein PC113_g13813 [Phytophthora cactorum]KAG2898977.1 hypothetical protein PC114_g14082 [Phytophthora cactorum]